MDIVGLETLLLAGIHSMPLCQACGRILVPYARRHLVFYEKSAIATGIVVKYDRGSVSIDQPCDRPCGSVPDYLVYLCIHKFKQG